MDGRITPEYKLSEALFLPYGNNLFSPFLKHLYHASSNSYFPFVYTSCLYTWVKVLSENIDSIYFPISAISPLYHLPLPTNFSLFPL